MTIYLKHYGHLSLLLSIIFIHTIECNNMKRNYKQVLLSKYMMCVNQRDKRHYTGIAK